MTHCYENKISILINTNILAAKFIHSKTQNISIYCSETLK